MNKYVRFLFIAGIAVMLAGIFGYSSFTHNNSYLTSGEAKLKAGQNKEALADLNKAIKHKPRLAESELANAFFDRGMAKHALGKIESAKLDFRKAIAINPMPVNATAYRKRGLAKSALGDHEGAKSDFKMAVSLGDISAGQLIQ
jgi:tetratricopeptide (TPR) repeat protein